MTWPIVRLQSISMLGHQYGANARAIPATGAGVRYVRITDIDDQGQLRPDSLSEPEGEDFDDYLLDDGDILFARSGATVGKAYRHVEENGPCVFAGYLIRFRPNPAIVDSRYLSYFLQTPTYWNWVQSKKRVAAQPNINGVEYASLGVPLAPLSEQRRIVEILDEADRLRRLRYDADAKAARILPALFLKMFGDPATNSMKWPMDTLGHLADRSPEYGANASAVPMMNGRPRYVRITDIRDDGTLSTKEFVSLDDEDWRRYLLSEGDVLFARSGNTVGKTYLYRPDDGECAFAGYLIRFRFKSGRVDPWFIFGLTRTSYYRAWVESHKRVAGQPNINGQEYANFKVPIPSQALQKEFAGRANEVEELTWQRSRAGERLDGLLATLVSQSFSGRLTAKWRGAHMKELVVEMERQAKLLNLPSPNVERLAWEA